MKPINREIEEIDADETEQIVGIAGAVDVAKASGTVCVRYSHPRSRDGRMSRVWEVHSTTNSLLDLGQPVTSTRPTHTPIPTVSRLTPVLRRGGEPAPRPLDNPALLTSPNRSGTALPAR